jgi:hypothetical protein
VKYRALAAKIGVSLASEGDRAKAFGPSTVVEVLGLEPGRAEQGGMCLNCDNLEFALAFYNGSIKDELVYTVAKALNDLADGLGIAVQVISIV